MAGFYWKLLTTQYTWVDQPDMVYQVLPWIQVQAAAWHRGEFPLWDPYVWGGQPLAGQVQPGAAYPLNWILFLLPLDSAGQFQIKWMNPYFVFTHVLAAWFAYWLCRDLKRTVPASILGGAAFSLSGVVGTLGWPQMLNGAIWLPLILLFFLRVARGEPHPVANAALSGTFLGVALLAGHHQIPAFAIFAMAILWAAELWRRRRHAAMPALAFGVCALLTGALQILPAIETGMRSIRWVGSRNPVFWGQHVPYTVHDKFSLPPSGLLGLVIADPARPESFAGLALFVLAILGVAVAGHAPRILFVAGIVLALGSWSVFHGIAYLAFPLLEKARTPATAIVLSQIAIAILAAHGLDSLRERIPSPKWIMLLAACGIAPWLAAAVLSRATTVQGLDQLAVFALASACMAVILRSRRALAVAPLAVVLFELGTVIGNFTHREDNTRFIGELTRNADLVEFLRRQPDFVRLEVDTDALPANLGDWYGIDTFRAYLGGMTSNVAAYENDRLAGGTRAVREFSLTHYAARKPSREGQELVYQGKSGVNIYRNPEALRWARIEREQPCESGDSAKVVERSWTRVSIQASARCPGTLVISQTWFPGWTATVDGHSVPVREMHAALQGVALEPGEHRVELRYRPMSIYLGAVGSLLGLAAAAFAARLIRSK